MKLSRTKAISIVKNIIGKSYSEDSAHILKTVDFPCPTPFKNSKPGDKWMKLFLKRNHKKT